MRIRLLCGALVISSLSFVACSRKSTPSGSNSNKNVNAQIVYGDKNKNTANGNPVTPVLTDSGTVPVSNERLLVILDKGGRLNYSSKNVPSYVLAANKALPANQPISAVQRSNLLSRQKVLLPLALYVPEAMASRTSKGQYYKYQNKYWYWKKSNGFYYLDEVYYQ